MKQAEHYLCYQNDENKPEITPEVIDVIRSLPDRRYNDEADLALGIEQQKK
jgi:hypothetical protein